jgi:hypothetical protein
VSYKEFNMAKIKALIMLVILAAFGILIAGCENGTGGTNGEDSLDKALVGKWYTYPTQVDDPEAEPMFEITASGRLISEANTNGEINVTTSGGIISAAVTLNGQTVESGTANYTVTGTTLLLSNPMLNGAAGGLFLPFVSAIQLAQAMGGDGYYHKSASSASGGTSGQNTLIIQGIPANVFAYGEEGGEIGVFPFGTTPEQAMSYIGIVAEASLSNDGIEVGTNGSTYELTIPLYDCISKNYDVPWTGSGTFTVYVVLFGGGEHYYKASPVSIASGTTTISFNNATEVFPD